MMQMVLRPRPVMYVLVSFVAVFSLGGLVFGWASLGPRLYELNVFGSYCSDDEHLSCEKRSLGCCAAQRTRMATMASMALFCADGVMVFFGELKDRKGSKWCFGVGASLSLCGLCLLSLAASLAERGVADQWFVVALCLMGLGGPGVFMGALSFGERAPALASTVSASTAAAWDASALVFLLFRPLSLADASLLWAGFAAVVCAATLRLLDDLDSSERASRRRMDHESQGSAAHLYDDDDDISYHATNDDDDIRGLLHKNNNNDSSTTTAATTTTVQQVLKKQTTKFGFLSLQDNSLEQRPLSIEDDSSYAALSNSPRLSPSSNDDDDFGDFDKNFDDDDFENDSASSQSSMCRRRAFRKKTQLLSGGGGLGYHLCKRRDTKLLLMFMAIYNLKSSFYIETSADEARLVFDTKSAASITKTFDVAFPVGGFFASFFVAALLNRFQNHSFKPFLAVTLLANAFCLLHLLPSLFAHYAAALVFGPARTFQWATYFHFVSSANGRYPAAIVGRLLGYSNLIIALIGDALVPALDAFVEKGHLLFEAHAQQDDDQNTDEILESRRRRYLAVNLSLAAAVALSSAAFLSHLRHDPRKTYSTSYLKHDCC